MLCTMAAAHLCSAAMGACSYHFDLLPKQASSRCLVGLAVRMMLAVSHLALCVPGVCMLRRAMGMSVTEEALPAQIKLHDFDEGALNGLEERSPADAMRILEVFRTSNPQEKDNKCEAAPAVTWTHVQAVDNGTPAQGSAA